MHLLALENFGLQLEGGLKAIDDEPQRPGVQKVPSEMLPTMGYQIHFYKAWAILLPLRIGTHRDLGLAPGPRRSGRQAMRVGFALRAQEALRRGQTHGEHQAALFFCEL